jgi:TonB-linked SusC/RagA family outer membrane protein
MRLTGREKVRGRLALAAVALVTLLAPSPAAAQQATVAGRVVSTGTSQPIGDARVYVVGTNVAASTNQDGRYQLRVAPGQLEVRVIRIGFQEQKHSVSVAPGAAVTADFTLSPSLVKLTEIVTTATGQQRRVELGNSVQTLGDVGQKVETAPVTNLSDLMVGKAPGVQVLAGNMTGSAPSIRIRGLKSLSLSSEPIYVIDGVRMNAGAINIGTASNNNGTTASYLNALNPEEIADIEIVKGPSAATLYGTDAANGVIVITTKKGASGPARWTIHAGAGLVQDRNNYPTQYALWGHLAAAPTTPVRCLLVTTVAATNPCIADSLTSYNLLADKSVSPIGNGNTHQWGAQVSGGSDVVRYFISGDFQGEQGTLSMPSFSRAFLDSIGSGVREESLHPDYFGRTSLRANISAALNPKVDVTVNAGYTRSDQRLPPADNNTISYLFQAMGNPGFKPSFACAASKVATTNCLNYSDKGQLGEDLGGYAQYTPANLFQRLLGLNIDRFITTADAQWRPLPWLQNQATVGMDAANRENLQICRFAECPASSIPARQGNVSDQRSTDRNLSAKLVSNATWQPTPTLNLRTTLGADYTNRQFEYALAQGNNLPPGALTVGAAAVQSANSSLTQADKTLGYYLQEQIGIRDRLYVTLAARSDQNSAFGTNFQRVIYPKASVSYIVSDESWFPHLRALTSLRLRGAYGASGVQPNSVTALQTFVARTVNLNNTITSVTGSDAPGLLGNLLGNPSLKPERSTEREFGFEARVFDRVNLDLTYYNNLTKDALISLPLAASSAADTLAVIRNLGSVRNSGIEATVTAAILDLRSFAWNLTVGGSHNTNKIESLGVQECAINTTDCLTGTKPNATIGTGANRDSVGFPIRGVYTRGYQYSDANGDGIISASEITVDPNFHYAGYAVPRDLVSVQNTFDLFQKKLSLNVQLDYRGGFSLFNNSTNFLCVQKDTCHDESDKNTPLADQARLVAARYLPITTTAGYWENGQFWRLREVGATVQLPDALNRRMNSTGSTLTLSARNLHVWTKYSGTDPEANYSTTTSTGLGNVQTDFLTAAPQSYFTVRLNLHY